MIRNSGGTFAIFGAMVKLLYVVGSVVRAPLCAQPGLEAPKVRCNTVRALFVSSLFVVCSLPSYNALPATFLLRGPQAHRGEYSEINLPSGTYWEIAISELILKIKISC